MAPRSSVKVSTQRQVARDERRAQADLKKQEREAAAGVQKAADSYTNLALNLGQGGNALYGNSSYGFNPITRYRVMLEWMYRGQWICGAACDHRAEDMTKAGVELHGTERPEDTDELQRGLIDLNVWGEFQSGVMNGRLYGGAIVVMLIDGQDLSTPLNINTVGPDDFKGLITLDRWMVEPSLNDLVSDFGPHLGKPKFYRVSDDAHVLRTQRIHFSRCFRFIGDSLPYWQAVSEQLWGTSVLERLYDRLIPFDSATAGTAQMLHKQHIRVYKIDNLRTILASGGPLQLALMKMLQLMKTMQSNEGMTVIDGKDDFTMGNVNATAGMSDAIIQFGHQIAGALGEPMVRLFGMSPGGLNATGESDLRTYYDNVKRDQESDFRVPLTTLFHVMAKSKRIPLDMNKFNFSFISLYAMTEPERAAVGEADTRSVLAVEEQGLIEAADALDELKRRGSLSGRWSVITQEMIDKVRRDGPPGPDLAPGAGAAENALLGSESGETTQNLPNAAGGPAEATGRAQLDAVPAGFLIEALPIAASVRRETMRFAKMTAGHIENAKTENVTRLWTHNPLSYDECCILVETAPNMPKLGEWVWWWDLVTKPTLRVPPRRVFFDSGRASLRRVSEAFAPPYSALDR